MNNCIAFFLTFLSGISTLLGLIPIFIKVKEEHKLLCSSLAFASGVMLSISIIDLIPEAFRMFNNFSSFISIIYVFIFLLFGIMISKLFDHTVSKYDNSSLYKVGIISMIGLIIHNIPEGIITFFTASNNIKLGISMTIAIAMHNIPEGISIGIPTYYSTNSKIKSFIYTFVAAISEIFGAFITYLFLSNYINNIIMGILFSVIAGIMIYISLYELLLESINYKKTIYTILFFLIGFVFMIINLLLL